MRKVRVEWSASAVLSDNYRRPKGRHQIVYLFFCYRLCTQCIRTFVFVGRRDEFADARFLLICQRHVEIPGLPLKLVRFGKFEKFKHAASPRKNKLLGDSIGVAPVTRDRLSTASYRDEWITPSARSYGRALLDTAAATWSKQTVSRQLRQGTSSRLRTMPSRHFCLSN